MFDFGPGVGASFFQDPSDRVVEPKFNSQAIAEDAVVVSGRKGFANLINGYYVAQPRITEAGLPTFKSTEKDETKRWRYIFFHKANNAWAIAHEIGGDSIVAYALGIHARPNLVTTAWFVVNSNGDFAADTAVRCACPPLAVSPFRRKILDQEVIELGAKLSRTEVIDLCGELSTPVSVVRRLTLNQSGMDTPAVAALFECIAHSCVLTHLTISKTRITDHGMSAIAKAIKSNKSLHLLSLKADEIGDGQMLELGKALRWNTSLHGLALRENNITEQGAVVLLEALSANSNLALRGLRLYDNKIVPTKKLLRAVAKLKSTSVELSNPVAQVRKVDHQNVSAGEDRVSAAGHVKTSIGKKKPTKPKSTSQVALRKPVQVETTTL